VHDGDDQLKMRVRGLSVFDSQCVTITHPRLAANCFQLKIISPHPLRVGKFFYVEIICTLPLFRVCSIRVKQLSTQSLPTIATWEARQPSKSCKPIEDKSRQRLTITTPCATIPKGEQRNTPRQSLHPSASEP
jgi:hypothetical protein